MSCRKKSKKIERDENPGLAARASPKKFREIIIRAWRLALGGRKPLSGVDLHNSNSLAKKLAVRLPLLTIIETLS